MSAVVLSEVNSFPSSREFVTILEDNLTGHITILDCNSVQYDTAAFEIKPFAS